MNNVKSEMESDGKSGMNPNDAGANSPTQKTNIGRRDLMKLGVGAGVAMAQLLNAPQSSAQPGAPSSAPAQATAKDAPEGSAPRARAKSVFTETGTGWTNNTNRISGNGPMDDTTRQVVEYVSSFNESKLTDPLIEALNNTMVDSMATLISGFESEPARICARLAKTQRSDLQCTMMGYGITTTPELATFGNTCMLRHTDYNDNPHNSDMISACLAVGEALHATGPQVLTAICITYEVVTALGKAGAGEHGWDGPYNSPAVAVACGKLMGLNEDQLANALSLALVPHLPMLVSHVGTLSHWKGCHSAEAARVGVFAALLAREGMTGPCQPFEGRHGYWDHAGPYANLRLPASPDGRSALLVIHAGGGGFKRTPSEGNSQAILEVIPEFRKFTKPDDIASIQIEFPFGAWQEIADPPKWDPRNRETADHSLAYVIARALIDGEIYVDSFAHDKIMDPTARRLMAVTTVRPNADFKGHQYLIKVSTKAGTELVKSVGSQSAQSGTEFQETPMTHQETIAKFTRICDYRQIPKEQTDRALAAWSNLMTVRDIAEPIRTLATFGQPQPL